MKKAFDQTVRDLKRGVNRKVLKVPGIEQKILDATSNEPWGPHGTLLADIADATHNHHEYRLIMMVVWKRINDTGKNWRHVYKGLTVLEYLVAHGSECVIDDVKEHIYHISTLSDFRYIDSKGRDQGNNVRIKSQNLVSLVNDKERIVEVRKKALANRDKFRSAFSGNRSRRSNYGSRYDDDHFGSRYGGRDEDQNGYGRERGYEYGPYNREGSHYERYADDRYGRERYRNDDNRYREGDYKFGPRSRSADGTREYPLDNDSYHSRNGDGANGSHVTRPIERKTSEPCMDVQAGYEEATNGASTGVSNKKTVETDAAPAPRSPSPPKPFSSLPPKSSSETTSINLPTSAATPDHNSENFDFDDFDPRGSTVSAGPAATKKEEVDLFGGFSAENSLNSLALVPVTSISNTSELDIPPSSGWEDDFEPRSSMPSFQNQVNQNPFGDPPFKATQENFNVQQQNVVPAHVQATNNFEAQNSGLDFGETFDGLVYTPSTGPPASTPGFPPSQPPSMSRNDLLGGIFPENTAAVPSQPIPSTGPARAQSAPPDFIESTLSGVPVFTEAPQSFHGQPGLQARSASTNQLLSLVPDAASPPNQFPQPGLVSQANPPNLLGTPSTFRSSTATMVGASKLPHPKETFETKSTVWADTINRGLVNLNISGPKTNADIGVDFDAINRKENREKGKSFTSPSNPANVTSTISMGKAMGSGSGIGRAGATGLSRPPNPMTGYGMGIGKTPNAYGGGMNQTKGTDMTMMNMGTMNMGSNQGMTMQSQTGMFPGHNQMGMGAPMGGYGSQPYGGYR